MSWHNASRYWLNLTNKGGRGIARVDVKSVLGVTIRCHGKTWILANEVSG